VSQTADLALERLEQLLATEPALRDLISPTMPRSTRPGRFAPQADIVQTEHAYVVLLDLPGVSIDDIDVHLEGTRLLVRGARRSGHPEGKRRSIERGAGTFDRSFLLPHTALGDAVTADLKDGVLRIDVPITTTGPQGRKIPIGTKSK
jgi:HSP20 family protein